MTERHAAGEGVRWTGADANGDPPSNDAVAAGTVDSLRSELDRATLANHLAFFYRSPQCQLEVAAAFVEHGLRTGNRCLYFVDTNTRETVERAFRAAGIDVEERAEAGDLLVRSGTDTYREAEFDPDRLIDHLVEAAAESEAASYDGLWVAGELSWCFHTDLSYDHVVDFEADFDAASADNPITALCQYDLSQFDDASVAKALWTHEQVIYRYTLCDNPYYVPPAEFRSREDRPLNARLMLEQMYTISHARSQVARLEQRLSVVNRILRHNIRNDLNVVRGVLEDLDEGDGDDRIATAIDHVEDIVDIADKARYVDRTIGRSEVRQTALAPLIESVVDRIESAHPASDLVVDGDTDRSVVADTNLDTALVELLAYAIRQQDADPRVSVTVSDAPSGRTRLDVWYPGPPIERNDRLVLDRGSETQLEHCRGLGLWLAKWIVENAHGTLEFPESADPRMRIDLFQCRD